MASFNIPHEFQSKLRDTGSRDTRTDVEILSTLSDPPAPVVSEKNIWAYWHGGLYDMPRWCQRNVCDWVRICSGWTVRVLDSVPGSPHNALNFIDANMLPIAFVKGEMTGPYRGQHSKDLLICACLYLYGGAFMDVGIFLIRHLDRVGWNGLEDPESPYEVALPLRCGQQILNHFVMSRKGDPLIKRWHDLFIHIWHGRQEFHGLMNHPLLDFVKTFDFNDIRAGEFKWSVKVDVTTIFEYAAQVICFLRLTMLSGTAEDAFDCSAYWRNNVFLIDSLEECFAAEKASGFHGERIYNALSLRVEADPTSDEYQFAYDLTWKLLTQASMMKITRGTGLSNDVHLGTLLDQNDGKGIELGTFAALLRYGATRFEQTRAEVVRVDATPPARIMSKGVLEP